MKKHVLIVSSSKGEVWSNIEKALLQKGMQLLHVTNLKEALFRTETEIFSAILFEDDADGVRQKEFAEGLKFKPFGVTTPLVILGPESQPKDQSLITSLLDQYFPIQTDPEMLADFLVETHELRKQKVKRGQIGACSVPQILYQASRFRMNGAIVFERQEEKCAVYFENGYIVFASSNRDENRFGEFLVARGVISRDQFVHSIEIFKRSKGKRLGKILVEEGFLKPQVLETLLQTQIKHIVFTVFDWSAGEFYILLDEHCEKQNAIAHAEVPPLILEGVRYKFSQELLEKEFAPFDSKISLAISLEEIQRRMHLGKNESDFLRLIGNGRPIEELLNLNSYSRLESLKLLYGFRVLGFIAVQKSMYVPSKQLPTQTERKQAVDELFALKKEMPKEPPKEIPPMVAAAAKPKGWRVGYMVGALSMGVGFTVLSVFFTLFNTQSSHEGMSVELDDPMIYVPRPPKGIKIVVEAIETAPTAPPAVVEANPTPPEAPPVPAASEVKPTSPEVAMVVPKTSLDEEAYQKLILSARQNREKGKLTDALELYRKASKQKPDDLEVILGIADTLFDLDRSNEALNAYMEAKKLAPQDARSYLGLGTIYLMKNERASAKKYFSSYLAVVRYTTETEQRIQEVRRILKNLEDN